MTGEPFQVLKRQRVVQLEAEVLGKRGLPHVYRPSPGKGPNQVLVQKIGGHAEGITEVTLAPPQDRGVHGQDDRLVPGRLRPVHVGVQLVGEASRLTCCGHCYAGFRRRRTP